MRGLLSGLFLSVIAVSSPAYAEFRAVQERGEFLEIVTGRTLVLTRPFIARPIEIQVLRNGELSGEARGSVVTGVWQWTNGRFCREMDWGGSEVGYSCQAVSKDGGTLKFVSDRGLFRTAYFEVR